MLMSEMASASNNGAADPLYTVVVQDIDYYPIYRADSIDDRYSGYLRDVLDAFAESRGIRFEYRVRPVRRMIWEFIRGHYDFAMPDHPNWNKTDKSGLEVYYSVPLVRFSDGVYVRAGNGGITTDRMVDYGTIHGFTPWKFQDRIDQGQIELITASSPESLVRMALAGRVEVFNLAAPVAEYHFRKQGVSDRFEPATHLLPDKQSSYHLSSLKHPDLVNALNEFLLNSPELTRALKEKYRFPESPLSH